MVGCALVLSVAPGAFAQIVFHQDFDSASLNVPASSVDNPASSSPLVTIAHRNIGWSHPRVYFRMTGVSAKTPVFQVTSFRQPAGHRHVFSYDQHNWQFFDYQGQNPMWTTFGHNSPFAEDTVYISHAIPYPAAKTDELVNFVSTSPWVQPTSSADSNLIVGQTLGTAGGGYVDDMGRFVPALNLYGFQITDPLVNDSKLKVVITSGNHADEFTGTHAMEGMVRFLVGDDPRADALRKRAIFYIYPQNNPEGRYSGYHRTSPQAPTYDHNREWDEPNRIYDIEVIEGAMKSDTGGDVDYFFDFHSDTTPDDIAGLWTDEPLIDSDYVLALGRREPLLDPQIWTKIGCAMNWAATAEGLSAEFSYTPEIGVVVGAFEEDYHATATNYALALYNVVAPIKGDMDGSGKVDADDINPFVLALIDPNAYHAGYYMDPNLVGDCDRSGKMDLDDIDPFVALLTGGSQSVPEPATLSLLAFGGLVLIRRRWKCATGIILLPDCLGRSLAGGLSASMSRPHSPRAACR